MSRDELIKLAEDCHWYSRYPDYWQRGLVDIYIEEDDPPGRERVVNLRDSRKSYLGELIGSCPLSDLKSIYRPWIIGPFNGKFFSLKSQRIWEIAA